MATRTYRETHYPSESIDVCEENIEMFFRFMYNRHMIWHRRFVEKLPKKEWTNDAILKETKYTNIYRELDRGTIWYLDNVASKYNPCEENSFRDLLWKTCIYRLCNRVETFEEVGFPDFDTYDNTILNNEFWSKLNKIALRNQPVMTSAHLSCPTRGGLSKVEGFIEAVHSLYSNLNMLCNKIPQAQSLPTVFSLLQVVHCVGVFTAYEIICDLMYTRSIGTDFVSGDKTVFKPFKEDDWANVGPGAKEGIRLLFPSTKGKHSIYNRMVELRDKQNTYWDEFDLDFIYYEKFTKGHLSLRSIEHSLCEFSKYWLQKHGLGKKRMKFIPDDNRIVNKNGLKYRIVLDETGEHCIIEHVS